MPLSAGDKLGPYEILASIGAGGMGEVYRARDTKLGREVPLKVLPEAFARDAERMARFQREAKVLASLNHPNVASIYGLEDSSSTRALVMELVEGPTLAERVKRGPIPMDEALGIAKQIAEALEYAHERGIVHRDLKPANVKVTNDDVVKVLDFGLAKAVGGEVTHSDGAHVSGPLRRMDNLLEEGTAYTDIKNSPTLSEIGTQAGVLLGTAAYMSPEQAKGKAVDRRADIWAFGVRIVRNADGEDDVSGRIGDGHVGDRHQGRTELVAASVEDTDPGSGSPAALLAEGPEAAIASDRRRPHFAPGSALWLARPRGRGEPATGNYDGLEASGFSGTDSSSCSRHRRSDCLASDPFAIEARHSHSDSPSARPATIGFGPTSFGTVSRWEPACLCRGTCWRRPTTDLSKGNGQFGCETRSRHGRSCRPFLFTRRPVAGVLR